MTFTSYKPFWPSTVMKIAEVAVPGWSRFGKIKCVAAKIRGRDVLV